MVEPLRILLHNDETDEMAAALHTACPDAVVAACNTYDDLPGVAAELRPHVVYTVRFAGTPTFPRAALFNDHGPLWVANGGAGTDHFGYWDKARTTVTNAAGVAADMMAEYVMGCFLHFTLDVPGLQADKARKHWRLRTVRPLLGKTLLIVGLGHTGRALAHRAKAFGMTVIGTRARPKAMADVDHVHGAEDLLAVLPSADFVAVATPLTERTRNLIDARAIGAMRPGVIVADVSRGGVVDQKALYAALRDGQIGAVALDVFEAEPLPQASPFWTAPNAIVSPHCSSVYEGWQAASFELFLANLARWRRGEMLTNIVDPDLGY